MKSLFWNVAALVGMTGGVAWAQTIILVCSTGEGYPMMVDVDYSNARVCTRVLVGENCYWEAAQISQRFIRWHTNAIDRATGMVTWASGSSGSCKKSEGGGF